jgi:hypothetical protein
MLTRNHTPTTGQCPSCGSHCNLKKDLDDRDYCNDCRPDTSTSKLTETLEQFRNGEERYDSDSTFKQAIDSLAAGVGVYAVLDSALRRLSHQQEVVSNLTNKLKSHD